MYSAIHFFLAMYYLLVCLFLYPLKITKINVLYIFLHPSHSCCLAVWGLNPCNILKPLWRVRSYIICSSTLFHYDTDEISNLVCEAMSNLALCLVQGYWLPYPSLYLNQKQQMELLLFILLSWVWLKHLKSNYKQGSGTHNVWDSYNAQYAKCAQKMMKNVSYPAPCYQVEQPQGFSPIPCSLV